MSYVKFHSLFLLECQPGSYGMNCNEACGQCNKNTTCRHDNGTCQQGCAAGYKSHDCKTRKVDIFFRSIMQH